MKTRVAFAALAVSAVFAYGAFAADRAVHVTRSGAVLSGTTHIADVTRNGLSFRPTRGPAWQWRLTRITAGGQDVPVTSDVKPSVDSDGAGFDRGSAIERYIAKARTVEQEFVIPQRIGNGDVVIEGAVESKGRFLPSKQGWTWRDRNGVVSLSRVMAFDACGTPIAATMNVTSTSTRITISAAALEGAQYPITIDPEVGTNDFQISTIGNAIYYPAVAYNSTNDEYFVVYAADNASTSEQEIWGHRVDGDGTILGSDIRISFMGSTSSLGFHANSPDVVYNATDNEYFVVWNGDDDTLGAQFDTEIYGARIDASTGAEIGSNLRISHMGETDAGFSSYSAHNPAIAWDSVNDHYIVAFYGSDDADSSLDPNETEIYAQLLSKTGTSLLAIPSGKTWPAELRVSYTLPDGSYLRNATAPAVAFDSTNQRYLVVWNSDGTPCADNENEIFGQFVTAAGALYNPNNVSDLSTLNFRISDMGTDGSTASQASSCAITYNPDAGEFLVVWSGNDVGSDYEIYGQRINASTGLEAGTNDFQISQMGPDGDSSFNGVSPAVAYSHTNQQYLVVWTGADVTAGDIETWGQRLSSTGAQVGRDDYRLSEDGVDGTTTYQTGDAAVTAGASGEMLVVWRANSPTLANSTIREVFGQRFKMANGTPTLSTGTGSPNFTENGSAATIAPSATVTDDSEDFSTGNLTIAITANGTTDDVLGINNEGTGSGQIGVSGSNVTYQGTTIGTYTGGTYPTSLVITLNDNSTPTATQALMQHITFSNGSENPSTTTRTVSFTLNDGDGATSTAVTKSVTVTAIDDPPSIVFGGGNITYTRGSSGQVIDSSATVSDPDGGAWNTTTFTATLTANGSTDDRLEIQNVGTGAGQIGVSGANVTYGGTTIGTYTGGSGTTPLVVTFNASASLAAAQALARDITFRNVDLVSPSTATRTVQFVFAASSVSGGSASKSIGVVLVNSNPAISLPSGGMSYTENTAAAAIDAAATVTDSDSFDFDTGHLTVTITSGSASEDLIMIRNQGTSAGQIGTSGSNVTYGGTVIGTYTGGSGSTPLDITFNSSSSPAAAQALARNIFFFSSADASTSRSVQFAITDGDGGSASASTTITITLVDDAPIVTLPSGAVNYTELDPATILDASATVSDVDSADFSTGQLQVDFALNGTSNDILEISSSGLIAVSGANVSYNGTQIGTFSGGTSGSALIVSLNASSNAANVQELARHITYRNDSQNPSTLQRTIEFLLNDGDGATSNAVTKLVNVTGISTAPTLTLSGNAASYTEGGTASVLDHLATVTDPDSSDFDTGSLVVTITANGQSDDRLSVRNQGTNGGEIGLTGSNVTYGGVQIGTLSGGSGTTALTITLNSSASVAATQALVQNITYSSVGDAPGTSRTIQFVVSDGDGGTSSPQSLSLTITPTNDAPVISLGNPSPSYVENGAPIVIAPSATVSDPDQPSDFNGGTVTVDFSENGSVDDRLSVQNTGTGSGQVGVSGSNITYEGVLVATMAGGSGTTPLVITFNASSTVAVVQSVVRNVTYSNVSDAPSVSGRTIRFVVADGQGGTSAAGVTALSFTAVNDAPVVTLPSGSLSYTAGDAATVIDSAATVTDPDSTDFASGTLTVSLTNATTDDRLEILNQGTSAGQIGTSGANVTYGGTTIGTYTGGSGTTDLVITFNPASSPAAAQALARNVTFRNVSSTPSVVARTVSFVVDDGDGDSSSPATKTINVACTATTHYGITSSSTVSTGVSTQLTLSALTAANAVSTCYTGTVHFTSTDSSATLPGNYTFTGGEGSHSFNFTMATVGSQTITATDTVTGSITATWPLTVQASTGTALASSANPSSQGQSVTFTATVTSSGQGTIGGTVTFKDGATSLGTTAVSGGIATFSTNALTAGSHSMTAVYNSDGNFLTSTSSTLMQTVNSTGAPVLVTATATGTTTISVSWSAVAGASSYTLYRSELNGGFSPVAQTANTFFTDTGLTANRTYLYKVAVTGSSSYSLIDPATTIVFTTSTVTPLSTTAQAAHITELRTAVNAIRAAAGLSAATFTDATLTAGMPIKAVHITELRTALNAARSAIGLTTLSYTDPTITAGVTTIKAAHITELRGGVQ